MTLYVVSRAPLPKLQAYKQRMGWSFPWASSSESDFNYDFHVTHTDQEWDAGVVDYNYRATDLRMPEGAENPFISAITSSVGTDWPTYRREGPGVSAFALDGGVVYHTYSSYERGVDASGACTRGSTTRHSGATRPASGGAATTSTTANEPPRREDEGGRS